MLRSTKHLQAVHFQVENYCSFTNSINAKTASSAFVGRFQRVSHENQLSK